MCLNGRGRRALLPMRFRRKWVSGLFTESLRPRRIERPTAKGGQTHLRYRVLAQRLFSRRFWPVITRTGGVISAARLPGEHADNARTLFAGSQTPPPREDHGFSATYGSRSHCRGMASILLPTSRALYAFPQFHHRLVIQRRRSARAVRPSGSHWATEASHCSKTFFAPTTSCRSPYCI